MMNLKGTRNAVILAGLLALAQPGPVKATNVVCGNYNSVYGATYCCIVYTNCCGYALCKNGQSGQLCGLCNYT